MRRRYAHKNYPDEFPYRCKCIAVFQTLDGVDVLLFALYLYEHGENNASPNTKKVYISYLDSVHFMRPRKMRTFIYHEILIGYLDYARRKGFVSAHIWACPPLKGDDYIFYCKPEDQKTPRDTRLRQWYMDMLVECQKRDIVGKITNMYDLYIVDTSLDATAIPYLEGDYFSGEAENIIKDLEEGKGSKSFVAAKKNKKKKGKETNYSRSNSTVTEVDDESDRKSICSEISKEEERDAVLVKLGDIIRPMKDSFIVAFLNWEGVVNQNEATIKSAGSQLQNMEEQKTETANDESSAVRAAKVIDDDKEDIDSDIINSRQAFLNLCRVNYYQFDQLRRAKYSSMMILWHLHNRDAPKFVQQCSLCKSDLLSGNRYHCSVCPDFDICEECYQDPNVVRGTCKHDLIPQPVDGDAQNASNGRSQLTEEQRRTRQEMSAAHIQLIEHASLCENPNCPSTNCPKMKKYLQHHSECKVITFYSLLLFFWNHYACTP
jgi:E1A/CREB-binding protein